MPRLASASVTVSLRAKDGADGKPGADGAPARYVYLRGTAHSSQHFDGVTSATTPALIKTSGGETDLSISSRGLTVVTLDRQTLRVASRQTFDTLTDSVARNQQLADHLAAQDDSVFLCIVSCDAFYLSKSKGGDVVIEALKAFGLGAVDRARLDYRCPFAFLGQKGLPEGYAYMAEGGNSQDYPDSHDVEFSVYTAGGAIAYAPAGRKGAMPRLRGEWTSGTTYQNQQDYVDVVLYDGAYYQCIAPAGAVTSTTNPKSDTQNWQPFNEYENLATGVLLAGKGLIQVLGAGKAFIGQTETGTGWEMTQGQIRHTGTGLALTADGKLSVPNPGALTITGGQTLEAAGRNLLKNSKYQKTTTEYLVQTCQSYEPLVRGERYTLVAKADFATEGHCLGLWDNKGSYCYTRALPCDEDGYIVYYLTFNYTKGNTAGFSFYHTGVGGSGNGSGSEVTLHWAVLYKVVPGARRGRLGPAHGLQDRGHHRAQGHERPDSLEGGPDHVRRTRKPRQLRRVHPPAARHADSLQGLADHLRAVPDADRSRPRGPRAGLGAEPHPPVAPSQLLAQHARLHHQLRRRPEPAPRLLHPLERYQGRLRRLHLRPHRQPRREHQALPLAHLLLEPPHP